MSRLVPCPSCHAHVFVHDRECPHCGAVAHVPGSPRAAAVMAGLMLSSCVIVGDPEPEYGVATTVDPGSGTSVQTDTGDTDGSSGSDTTGSDTAGSDTAGSGTTGTTGGTADGTVGEPEYGVPESSSSSDSAGEPDSGVAETSG